jgi:hypothetical protein
MGNRAAKILINRLEAGENRGRRGRKKIIKLKSQTHLKENRPWDFFSQNPQLSLAKKK